MEKSRACCGPPEPHDNRLHRGAAILDHRLRLEDQMVDAVNSSVERIRGHKMLVEEYLLDFLVRDEKKHAALLRALDKVKRGMYPYA